MKVIDEDLTSRREANIVTEVLLNNLDVETVLDRYGLEVEDRVPSRKGGMELVCCCPFHETTSANFLINDSNGRFFCRSAYCGVKGSIIDFVALMENINSRRAMATLCQWAGVEEKKFTGLGMTMSVLDSLSRETTRVEAPRARPLGLPVGFVGGGCRYLEQERGIDRLVLAQAGAGRVPGDKFMAQRECVPVQMGRHVYSLYSRATVDGLEPRHHYTDGSQPNQLLYGLEQAVNRGGDTLILVEAIISVLKLRTLGFHNAIALFKSDISQYQIHWLLKASSRIKNVIICTDNDLKEGADGRLINPGQKSAWKIYRRLKRFFNVGVARLPINIDPADMDEAEEFEEVLAQVQWPARQQVNEKFVAQNLGPFFGR